MFTIWLLVDCKDYVWFMTKNKQKLWLHKVKILIVLYGPPCRVTKAEGVLCDHLLLVFLQHGSTERLKDYRIGSTSTLKMAGFKSQKHSIQIFIHINHGLICIFRGSSTKPYCFR